MEKLIFRMSEAGECPKALVAEEFDKFEYLRYREGLEVIQVGDVKMGRELGFASPSNSFILLPCSKCGRLRWVGLYEGKPKSKLCKHCVIPAKFPKPLYGEAHPRWKGGRLKSGGYILVLLKSDDPFYVMTQTIGKKNTTTAYILEHRLVMAKSLGRLLKPEERVHHKNGIKDDNRIENLELFTMGEHITEHNKGYQNGYQRGYLDGLEIGMQAGGIIAKASI